ncbi:MAG: hypothetical protein Q8936_15845 [Bacillota bacterium]|nr:hypothetical protein [Bacillota bacterium]
MRRLSESEVLSLREILQSETVALQGAKAMQAVATDQDLKNQISSSITAAECRIKGIQQFISENEILPSGGVH